YSRHYFNITKDYNISKELPTKYIKLFYMPILSYLLTINKNLLILIAAYKGNLRRYIYLYWLKVLYNKELAVIYSIYYNTTFTKR
ncbi:hypothetical protein LZ30DRAFT_607737, partial [Colletotrichum cereale]